MPALDSYLLAFSYKFLINNSTDAIEFSKNKSTVELFLKLLLESL